MSKKELTIEDWKCIKNLRDKGFQYGDIAEKYNVTAQCIQQGLKRKERQYRDLIYIFEN